MAAIVGVIGGSGLEEILEDGETLEVDTPYGVTVVTLGELGGRPVVALARHGAGHAVPPHRINARANLWALASLDVRAVVSTAAVGSLRAAYPPESFAIADQLIDRTWGRAGTFFDDGPVQHLPFAEPFCPELRSLAVAALPDAVPEATVAVIQGPRFSTRAEAAVLRDGGADLVNMTLCPEVALAAEIGIGTVTICIVTDTDTGAVSDTGVIDPDAVTAELVFRRLAEAKPRILDAVAGIVAAIPEGYAPRPLIAPDVVAALRARPVR